MVYRLCTGWPYYLSYDDSLAVNSVPSVQKNLADSPKSKKQVQSGPGSGTLQPSRAGVDLLDDLVVGVTRSLNR